MKNMLITASILIFAGLSVTDAADSSVGWKCIKNSNGIKTYSRQLKENIYEFRGISIINARMEVLAEIMSNIPDYSRWMSDCKKIKLLKMINEKNDEMIIHYVSQVPWPLTDRDAVVRTHSIKDFDNGRAIIIISKIDYPQLEKNEDYVRIKDLRAQFTLDYIDRKHTGFTFEVRGDPSGYIPSSLANLFIARQPYNTISALKKIVREKKYIEAGKRSRYMPLVKKYIAGKEK